MDLVCRLCEEKVRADLLTSHTHYCLATRTVDRDEEGLALSDRIALFLRSVRERQRGETPAGPLTAESFRWLNRLCAIAEAYVPSVVVVLVMLFANRLSTLSLCYVAGSLHTVLLLRVRCICN